MELTNKTHCVVNRDIRIYVSEEQAGTIMAAIENKGTRHIEVEGQMLPVTGTIVVTTKSLEQADRARRGEWQCREGEWHPRHEQCTHQSTQRTADKKWWYVNDRTIHLEGYVPGPNARRTLDMVESQRRQREDSEALTALAG